MERAALVVTSGLVERFNAFEDVIVDMGTYRSPAITTSSSAVDPLNEIGVEITPEGACVEYQTPRGAVRRSLSFDPERTYLVLSLQDLRTILVIHMQMGEKPPVVIVREGKAYETTTCILGDYAESVTPLARAVGLMSNWDLLVRLDVSGETVAFDLVKSDGSGAYRVVCDLNTGKGSGYPPTSPRRVTPRASGRAHDHGDPRVVAPGR